MRLQADVINRQVIPAFYRYLQAQDQDAQIESGKDFLASLVQLTALFERTSREVDEPFGLWSESGNIGLADIMVGPCQFS